MTQASKEPGDLGVLGLYRGTPISYEFPLRALLEGPIDLNVTADQVIVPSVRAFFPIVKLTHFPLRTTS